MSTKILNTILFSLSLNIFIYVHIFICTLYLSSIQLLKLLSSLFFKVQVYLSDGLGLPETQVWFARNLARFFLSSRIRLISSGASMAEKIAAPNTTKNK